MNLHAPRLLSILIVWLLAVSGVLAADARKPELLLVYWSSEDCRWCTYWESSLSGMERRLKESREFRMITYRVVKNKRLADPYTRDDFPKDIHWLYERVQRGEEKRTGRPGWVVYVERKRIATFYGTRDWDEKHLPEIKRLVARHAGG
jgi:hypothetical protein